MIFPCHACLLYFLSSNDLSHVKSRVFIYQNICIYTNGSRIWERTPSARRKRSRTCWEFRNSITLCMSTASASYQCTISSFWHASITCRSIILQDWRISRKNKKRGKPFVKGFPRFPFEKEGGLFLTKTVMSCVLTPFCKAEYARLRWARDDHFRPRCSRGA